MFVFLNELFILLERWGRNESITNMLLCFDNELGRRSDTKPKQCSINFHVIHAFLVHKLLHLHKNVLLSMFFCLI